MTNLHDMNVVDNAPAVASGIEALVDRAVVASATTADEASEAPAERAPATDANEAGRERDAKVDDERRPCSC